MKTPNLNHLFNKTVLKLSVTDQTFRFYSWPLQLLFQEKPQSKSTQKVENFITIELSRRLMFIQNVQKYVRGISIRQPLTVELDYPIVLLLPMLI